MPEFYSLTPSMAVEFIEAAGVPHGRRILSDFAAAGLIKAYAEVIETIADNGSADSLRGLVVRPELWQRIVREGVVGDVWTGGTVRLSAGELIGSLPEVRITAISFSERHLQRVVDRHRCARLARKVLPITAPVISPPPVTTETAEPPLVVERSAGRGDMSAIPPGALLATVYQAQCALGLGRTKVTELMNDGTLVRKTIGRAVRIEVGSIQAFGTGKGICRL